MLIVNRDNARLRISGIIGEDVTSDELAEALYDFGDRALRIDLQSPGGLVDEGMAMYDQLRDYEGSIEIRLQGIVGSIATVVMLGGSSVVASEASQVFVHDAWSIAIGNAAELREVADGLEELSRQMATIYARHSKKSVEEWLALMSEEVFLTPEQALDAGIIHGIFEGGKAQRKEEFKPVAKMKAPRASFGGDPLSLRVRIERLRANS